MADENNQQTDPGQANVTQTGGTQSVQFGGDPEGRAQEEANRANPPRQDQQAQRPEGLPEGFDTWEAYGKAVQAGTHNADGTTKEAPKQEASPAELTAQQKADVQEALSGVPEDSRAKAQPFFEEFARTGGLSDQAKADAAKAFGVSEAMVDQYIAGYQANEVAAATAVLTEAGVSQSDFDAFKEWAETGGMTQEQMDAYNSKPQAQAIKDAVAEWKAGGNGPGPRDITRNERPGPGTNQNGPEPYQSIAEMQRDMNDPRYSSDEAFRKKVEQRVGASDLKLAR